MKKIGGKKKYKIELWKDNINIKNNKEKIK
jgi:hypothetical protein